MSSSDAWLCWSYWSCWSCYGPESRVWCFDLDAVSWCFESFDSGTGWPSCDFCSANPCVVTRILICTDGHADLSERADLRLPSDFMKKKKHYCVLRCTRTTKQQIDWSSQPSRIVPFPRSYLWFSRLNAFSYPYVFGCRLCFFSFME